MRNASQSLRIKPTVLRPVSKPLALVWKRRQNEQNGGVGGEGGMRQAGQFRGEFSAADNESGQLLEVNFPPKG